MKNKFGTFNNHGQINMLENSKIDNSTTISVSISEDLLRQLKSLSDDINQDPQQRRGALIGLSRDIMKSVAVSVGAKNICETIDKVFKG